MARQYDSVECPFCDEVTKYEKLAKIGQGTYGVVFKAKHRQTGRKVALKKVLMDNQQAGFPITALREIKILQLLKHENVVNLIEICRSKPSPNNGWRGSIYLVLDLCEHDLAGLLGNVLVKFTLSEIKRVMQMLLNGLYYLHRNKILHRDMKAANVLITRDGVLKLADFGLARAFSLAKNRQPNRYTNRVVTLWYRPPELLLGARDYGPPIDLWGAGCIMAEMWIRSPIMQGHTEQHQLALISQLCGSITPEVWPNVDRHELYGKLELVKGQKRKVKDRLRPYVRDPHALDLIDKLLVLDPAQRVDSDDALDHDFFWSDPMPSDLKGMLSNHLTSMFEYLAPPRWKGSQITQQSDNRNRNPATINQTHFERVF
ncbi:cyclin-dependent kinase 9-like [Nycticebus coucang]|uniref:cyclin-dependent kinase 9-like n=1 Tax=Nycticebus coucang TaxID=9470 RepID=UPI00234C6647|nr:cyclin-dependent kinase 9-like [Nycticebus coucang]XP_053462731.1 cyclin-dependent kinase 9-like [Nycticebus coucang]